MDPAIKKVVAVLAAALIVVIGAICVINFANMDAAVTTDNGIKTQENQNIEDDRQADADAEPIAEEKPTDEAQAGETGVTNEAPNDDVAQNDVMYEGALAGLSEEEIAKMALAEEESAARTETTGAEDAVD
ncbi:MAG: hypothetical protein ACI4MP_03530 [Candidatus Ventricola sp.]